MNIKEMIMRVINFPKLYLYVMQIVRGRSVPSRGCFKKQNMLISFIYTCIFVNRFFIHILIM